jgi:hypothetical protein
MINLLRAVKTQVDSLASYIFTIFDLNVYYLVPKPISAYLGKVLNKLKNHHNATNEDYLDDVEPFQLGFGLVLSRHLKSISDEAAPSASVNMFVYEGRFFTCNL